MKSNLKTQFPTAELRHRAEARLRERRENQRPAARAGKSEADTQRLHHELQVHQVELEMQNAELQEARDRLETQLEKYSDLYDFAPVGYFSLDEQSRILEMNLTGAALLGRERSGLINARLSRFVAPASGSVFLAFLKRVFAKNGKQVCEATMLRGNTLAFWASMHGISAISTGAPLKWCRVAISDITSIKEGEEAQRRMEVLAVANQNLKREMIRRQAGERALKKSEQNSSKLLEQSQQMQEQLRFLSRQLLSAQEEERKKISRELHDVIAQTLTSINIRLAALKKGTSLNTKNLDRNIARTQHLVQQSVDIVHRFARELRPTVLDDLGLIPALQTFMKSFQEQTGIRVSLSAFAAVEQLSEDKRTMLYRVAQEALTNVGRHAQASKAEVNIQKLDGAICMKIKDNGKGFQEERMLRAKKNRRLGLLGMRERLEMVGGNFSFISVPGKGTTIQAQIPLVNAPPRGGGGKSADGIH